MNDVSFDVWLAALRRSAEWRCVELDSDDHYRPFYNNAPLVGSPVIYSKCGDCGNRDASVERLACPVADYYGSCEPATLCSRCFNKWVID